MKALRVVVASHNPVKISASKRGFSKVFPKLKLDIQEVSVASGVSDQPMSSNETLKGALNRASNAAKKFPGVDYLVGIEGGLEESDGELEAFAWIVIVSKAGKVGKSRTASFLLPQKITKLIKQGKELGEADDIVFGTKNSKQANGAVGILTGDIITRTTFYEPAVVLALIPFRNEKLY